MSRLPELLPIRPFTAPARGHVTLPGSKSLTNRALLLAALCEEPVELTGALSSEDTQLMAEALRAMGFKVASHDDGTRLLVEPRAGAAAPAKEVDLFVGLAGTAARFLTAFCASAPAGSYRLDGVPQMRKRPMRGLIEALRALGAEIRCAGEDGFFPLEVHARGLNGGRVEIDASASSQLLSALLMVAPRARGPVEIELVGDVRWSFVAMTLRLMGEFGAIAELPAAAPENARGDPSRFMLRPQRYRSPGVYAIEPDATAASYWQALPLVVGGDLQLPGLRPPGEGLQGDSAFAEVLDRVRTRRPGQPLVEDFHEISDTFLTLAAIAPLLDGPTRLTGLAHTRHQETDRVAGMAAELRRLGQEVEEEEGALTIHPRPLRPDQTIETYGDHRFAMSFGILGCHDLRQNGQPWLTVRHPGVCAKTFPHFFELLEQVREKSSAS